MIDRSAVSRAPVPAEPKAYRCAAHQDRIDVTCHGCSNAARRVTDLQVSSVSHASAPFPADAYLDATSLAELARTERLRQVLVRMGGCRFIAAAQDAKTIIDALEAAGDYCRDVTVRA